MFELIKKISVGFLTVTVIASNHTNYMSLINQKYMTQIPLLIYILLNTVKNFTTFCLRLN